jgi:hypothetical protein
LDPDTGIKGKQFRKISGGTLEREQSTMPQKNVVLNNVPVPYDVNWNKY